MMISSKSGNPFLWALAGLAVTLGLSLVAGNALAGPFDGIYKPAETSDCGIVGEEGGSLRIADGIFFGIDNQCLMTRPVDVINMDATLYTMECTSGEGDWQARAMIMTAAEADGIIMVWNGYAFVYERCPEGSDVEDDSERDDAPQDETSPEDTSPEDTAPDVTEAED
jgi:hypothetical protein